MIGLLDALPVDVAGLALVVMAPEGARVAEDLEAQRGAGSADVITLPAPEPDDAAPRVYDVALVGDVLYQLSPSVVERAFAWVYEHLRPGGRCLVQTRTYFGSDGAGLADRVRTPFAQLAFAEDVIEEYYAGKGWPAPHEVNCMCRATYLVLFHRVGFVIDQVAVHEQEPQQFADKLQFYDFDELRAGGFTATLRRPPDEAEALVELRATLRRR